MDTEGPDSNITNSATASFVSGEEQNSANVQYEIDKIVDVKQDENGKVLYKARCVVYTWIPEDFLLSFDHLIKDFLSSKNDEVQQQGCGDSLSEEQTIQLMVNVNTSDEMIIDGNQPNIRTTVSTKTCCDDVEDSAEKHSVMYCPKCNQRFFLKSNLEVHILFCNGKSKTEEMSEQAETQTKSNHEEIVFYGSETYEYVPMDSSHVDCAACSNRFQDNNTDNPTVSDITKLLAFSQKKIISDKVEVYVCESCGREFLYKHPSKVKVTEEDRVDKTEKQRKEKVCERKKIKPAKEYKCSICNRGFEQETDMLEHEVKHTNTASRYACGSCNEKFVTRNSLQQHYDADNDCHPRKCDICGRKFVHANHLKRHMSIHAGVKPFVCTICGHEFNQKSDLFRHEKRHTVDGKLSCSKCVQNFDTVEDLRQHVKLHKKEETKASFTCERCGSIFGRKSHYRRHISIHDGIKPFSCEQCGKSFNQRSDLKRHVESHARRDLKIFSIQTGGKKNVEMLTCNICNKVFSTNSAFTEHNLTHQKVMKTGASY